MYGFCRLGVIPAPSSSAGCVANGLATNTTRNAKNVATAANTGTTHTMRSRAHARFRLTAAAPKPVRTSSQRSSDPSWPPPERRDRVRRRQRLLVVRATYSNEVVSQERREENAGGHGRRHERRHEGVLRGARQAASPEVSGIRACDERVQRQAESDEERGSTQLRHARASGRGAALLRRVLRRALRDHRARVGDERALVKPAVDHDVPADLEEIRHGARIPNGDDRRRAVADVLQPEAKAPSVRVAAHRSNHDTGELNLTRSAGQLAGCERGIPPPAIDVYSRNTASTAATDSAMTSRAGLAFRATGRV